MKGIERLTELFSKFPGIGARQARRFVYFLLQSDPVFIQEFLLSVESLKKEWTSCGMCFRFFHSGENQKILCKVCADKDTDKKILMVVEKDIDLENIEKSGTYKGRYFVLGGLVPLLNGKQSPSLRLNELREAVQKQIERDGLEEVVLALSAHPEGEHTMLHLEKFLTARA